VWTPVHASAVRGAIYSAGSQWLDSRGASTVQRRGGGFTTVDLGFTRTLSRRYDLAADVINLFDTLYEQAYALPREGRAAILTLRVRVS
jgi:outer membrane receptor protein involved in Fe transport